MLADGKIEIAIVVVDSCMMPRPVLDKAKANAPEAALADAILMRVLV